MSRLSVPAKCYPFRVSVSAHASVRSNVLTEITQVFLRCSRRTSTTTIGYPTLLRQPVYPCSRLLPFMSSHLPPRPLPSLSGNNAKALLLWKEDAFVPLRKPCAASRHGSLLWTSLWKAARLREPSMRNYVPRWSLCSLPGYRDMEVLLWKGREGAEVWRGRGEGVGYQRRWTREDLGGEV